MSASPFLCQNFVVLLFILREPEGGTGSAKGEGEEEKGNEKAILIP